MRQTRFLFSKEAIFASGLAAFTLPAVGKQHRDDSSSLQLYLQTNCNLLSTFTATPTLCSLLHFIHHRHLSSPHKRILHVPITKPIVKVPHFYYVIVCCLLLTRHVFSHYSCLRLLDCCSVYEHFHSVNRTPFSAEHVRLRGRPMFTLLEEAKKEAGWILAAY